MKYLLAFSLCLLFLVQNVKAQFEKGVISLGGSLNTSFDHSEITQIDTISVNAWGLGIAPSIGYYYNNSSEVGISYGFNYSNTENKQNGVIENYDNYTNDYGLFWRNNYELNKMLGLFGIINPEINYSSESPVAEPKQSTWNYGISTQIGAYFFPCKRISVETSLTPLSFFYSRMYSGTSLESTSEKFNFGLQSTNYFLSFIYYFSTGKTF